ncbi:hypothetical protein Q8W71_07285 [Methylobacterium sp. NEAU 140]|uniref:hypothetical protein n=1 Tax=Methylobacterium sp. NEAU 140 TaxID=3064945 RepID=UPI0027346E1C|nr:hypothetical protein [Methylobacterium sp. NEAU 140]MDP4022420.1 hypothetical protein [Methylobacterium sp. NEAU 140]
MLAFVLPALLTASLIVGLVLPHSVVLALSAALLTACLVFFVIASWDGARRHGSHQD